VRLIRRADGYYVQFCVKAERKIKHVETGKQIGIDVGLRAYSTDSDGNTIENPRYFRQAERRLKHLHRRLSRKKKGSKNRNKARKHLAKAHLKVQRQREDFVRKQAIDQQWRLASRLDEPRTPRIPCGGVSAIERQSNVIFCEAGSGCTGTGSVLKLSTLHLLLKRIVIREAVVIKKGEMIESLGRLQEPGR
jgi:hypothetical protein